MTEAMRSLLRFDNELLKKLKKALIYNLINIFRQSVW